MKEGHRALWYASDGLNGKIGYLGKPPGWITLNRFQESLDAGLELTGVLAGLVARVVHKRTAARLGGIHHGKRLHLVERAELQGHVDDTVGM